jgi:hypothetical protein
LRGTAGGAVAPLTTQGRLAPVGLVPELALGAPEGVEGTPPRLPPRSRERGTGTDSPTVKSTPSRRLTHQSPCLGLFLYFAWLRGRNLRELPHNQPCHDGEAPEAPTFPARGIAGRVDGLPSSGPSPRTLPDRNITALRLVDLFDWPQTRAAPDSSDFSRGGGSGPPQARAAPQLTPTRKGCGRAQIRPGRASSR